MIIREDYLREDGVMLTRTYSDQKKYIKKAGTEEIYSEAIDVIEYEYEETDKEIEDEVLE